MCRSKRLSSGPLRRPREWGLGRFRRSSVVPLGRTSHAHSQLDLETWDRIQHFALLIHLPTMRPDPSMRSPLVCLAAHNWKLRRWVDFRKCQTATATPAEPGGLSVTLETYTCQCPFVPEFVSDRAAMYPELRKRGTSQITDFRSSIRHVTPVTVRWVIRRHCAPAT